MEGRERRGGGIQSSRREEGEGRDREIQGREDGEICEKTKTGMGL